MYMRILKLFCLLSAITLIINTLEASEISESAEPLAKRLIVERGALKVQLVTEKLGGKSILQVILENPSADFLCVDLKMLDSKYQHIRLQDRSGKNVPLSTYADPTHMELFGFDYDQSYLFLLPNKTRKVGVDIGNFVVKAGSYAYDIIFLYYRCSDIIDIKRINEKKFINTFEVHATGTIVLEPEQKK
jgi:hypothetical protein